MLALPSERNGNHPKALGGAEVQTPLSLGSLRPDRPVVPRLPDGKAWVVAVLGAESTGKTALALSLSQALTKQHGLRCTWVGEWLRAWCEQAGRTPRPDEQAAIAAEQTRRISEACRHHQVVVADTTALMTAVYSQFLFQDTSLMPMARQVQQGYAVTLLTANDLPWQADGLQRDGPQVREPVRALIEEQLKIAGTSFHEVSGEGPQRLARALATVQRALSLAEA